MSLLLRCEPLHILVFEDGLVIVFLVGLSIFPVIIVWRENGSTSVVFVVSEKQKQTLTCAASANHAEHYFIRFCSSLIQLERFIYLQVPVLYSIQQSQVLHISFPLCLLSPRGQLYGFTLFFVFMSGIGCFLLMAVLNFFYSTNWVCISYFIDPFLMCIVLFLEEKLGIQARKKSIFIIHV